MLRTLTVAIVLTVAASSVFGQAEPPPPPPLNPDLAPAVKLLREGESKKALDLLKQAVKNNKFDGEAWYYLGIANLQISDFKKASEAFKRAISTRPDLAAPAHAGYAYSLVLRNMLASAAGEADKALAIDPNNIEALYTLAIVDLRRGARIDAIKRADAIIALKPDFAAVYLLISQAFVSSTGGVLYPNPNQTKEDRQFDYRTAADALEKYLKFETNPVAAQPWKEQLETLKFYLGDKPGKNEIFTGRDVWTKARLISKPEPAYTQRARAAQVTGTVVIKAVFAADGNVKHLLIVEALPAGLTEACIAAAKSIKFVPATRDGKPVSMWMQLEYNFNLY
ncbi:MAG TPA: TonB family protein [Pyrinomonadaceae bacterium]|nr:TonB family protein [Pyrinomonadaceae bacterium]